MIGLVTLVVAGFAIVAALIVLATFAKVILWLVLLPLRLILYVLLLPLLILKLIVGGIATLIVLPVLAIVGILLAAVFALPLLPFVAIGFVIWLLVRGNRPSAVAVR